MYALYDADTDRYVENVTTRNIIHFTTHECKAKRWDDEADAQSVLTYMKDKGAVPYNADLRIVEVEDTW